MIYKFRLISDEESRFKLEIEADADDTFFNLRNAILEAAGYTIVLAQQKLETKWILS